MYLNAHQHTHYSNLRLKDAISKVEDLIEYNHQLGHLGTCITEHECVSSAIHAQKYFFEKKKEADWENDKLLLGNEIYLCPNGMNAESEEKIFPHFILIALDEIGHKQIRTLSTRAWSRAFQWKGMMRVPTYYSDLFEIIGENPGHVVGSTACLGGMLATQLLAIKEDWNVLHNHETWLNCKIWVGAFQDLFGKDKFFLEMQPSYDEEQRHVNRGLLQLSKETGAPYIITTDVHYIKKEDAPIHKVFIESQEGERETEKFYATTYCMREEEIHEYLDDNIGKEAVQVGLDNTKMIYDMAEEYDLRKTLHIPYTPLDKSEPDEELYQKYKEFVPLFQYYHDSPYDSDRHLLREILKFTENDEYSRTEEGYFKTQECLEYLKISSEKMNLRWSAYLLSVADYAKICWEAGSIVGPGRGSGVGFRLLYMLGITQVDPLREQTELYPWRFMNPDRASVLDIDIDINPYKKDGVVENIRQIYKNVSKVATFSTEKSRSAIQSAARGLGYNDDYAQFLGSMIVADRGNLRTLNQMYYGDDDCEPDPNFRKEMDSHPDLWEASQKIEGLIKGCGSHAGGVIITDQPFVETAALMKTSTGETITQFDLHECEEVDLIKIDLLVTEFVAKEQVTLELLLKDHVIEWQGNLKDTYEKYLGVYTLERDDPEMWKLLWDKKIYSFFQMEKDSGIQAIALTKPQSVDDLTVINSVMRLMAQGEGKETPLEKYARFKNDITEWYKEMEEAGLTQEEQDLLKQYLSISYGICESQEKLMILPQVPEIGGLPLIYADKLRKAVAKKKPKEFLKLEEQFFENAKTKGLSKNLTNYVWYTLIYTQRGYGFNASHALAYSICGLQCLNLCWKFPIIYWNTACLIVDSGSLEETEDNKGTKTDKIAVAIANMQKSGILIELPYINEAGFGFIPDAENNRILFSLKAISGVGEDAARLIIKNRPFNNMEEFYEKMIDTKLIKPMQMIQLIKAGCFVQLHNSDRVQTMLEYLERYLVLAKDKLTFANLKKMISYGILNDERIINLARIPAFADYVMREEQVKERITTTSSKRKLPKCGYYDRVLVLDEISQPFFKMMFSEQSIVGVSGEYYLISEKAFLKECEILKTELSDWFNKPEVVDQYNRISLETFCQEKAPGTVSSWEMNALSYYYSEHELAHMDNELYGVEDFYEMSEDPIPYDFYSRRINGKLIQTPKFMITRIAGTVVGSNNDKHFVTLLTTSGIVNVKFSKGHYVFYNKKISVYDSGSDKKNVLEESWFKKGTKIIVCGYRNGFNFRAYRYSDTIYTHIVSRIEAINEDGTLELKTERERDE